LDPGRKTPSHRLREALGGNIKDVGHTLEKGVTRLLSIL